MKDELYLYLFAFFYLEYDEINQLIDQSLCLQINIICFHLANLLTDRSVHDRTAFQQLSLCLCVFSLLPTTTIDI